MNERDETYVLGKIRSNRIPNFLIVTNEEYSTNINSVDLTVIAINKL